MSRKSQQFPTDHLSLVAKAESFHDSREPPLRIGDWVQLNSGGPRSLVVDATSDEIIVAWKSDDQIVECALPRACIHRVS
jgi:uncharacterized protein YodC (DUF2158 family)